MTVGVLTPDQVVRRLSDQLLVMPDGCWRWTGALNGDGYGVLGINGRRNNRAHKVMFEAMRGPVPVGLTLDHQCHNRSDCQDGVACPHRACINPGHLDPITSGENTLRGRAPSAVNARKTHCPQGHALSGLNLINARDGRRKCKTCHRERARAARAGR